MESVTDDWGPAVRSTPAPSADDLPRPAVEGCGPGPIRVLVIDDDPLVRQALTGMFAESDDIVVVGQGADGTDAEHLVEETRPTVVLMDLRMPGLDGIAATGRLTARAHAPRVLILTTFETDEEITGALRAGASGYLLKHTAPAAIEDAIKDVAAGAPAVSPSVMRFLITSVIGNDPAEMASYEATLKKFQCLSQQELAVAVEIGRGHSNAQVAKNLSLSVSTIKTYTSSVLAKLHLDNRTQLALLVNNAGLSTEARDG